MLVEHMLASLFGVVRIRTMQGAQMGSSSSSQHVYC